MRFQKVGFLALVILGGASVAAGRDWTAGFARYHTENGVTMPYRLYLPKDYDPSIKYPYVQFLHGAGERGTDNTKQVKYHIGGLIDRTYEDYPAILVAPQLPPGNTYWGGEPYTLNENIFESLKQELSVDEDRVYLTGLSLGGFGTTEAAYYYPPGTFAAIAPMSAAIDIPPSVGDPVSKIPTWLFHGSSDGTVGVHTSRNYFLDVTGEDSIDFTETVFSQPTAVSGNIRYTEFQGWGHNIWSAVYGNADPALYDWMFAQAIPEPSIVTLLCVGFAFLLGSRGRRPF